MRAGTDNKVRIAIAGIGNCASSLIQGIEHYRSLGKDNPKKSLGLMHYDLGGYAPGDIEVVAAFDIDSRKVGKSLRDAVFAKPNCTKIFYPNIPDYDVTVMMGKVLDGVSRHMSSNEKDKRVIISS
ncbi:MAG: inositol-3-phosphate synthase, partial [Nitrospirota bacterium]